MTEEKKPGNHSSLKLLGLKVLITKEELILKWFLKVSLPSLGLYFKKGV